ncbi:MAG: hypothetical protein HZC42_09265 [Candidatus Eisenbacteria bacterium]|nr:hypothetical protein [Candidatus Eisenbacteria bacterium]
MRDERAGRGAAGAAAVALGLACLAGAAPAHAQGLKGFLQVQFQRVEQNQTVMVDGVPRQVKLTRESWVQTYELDHVAQVRQNLSLVSQLRWIESTRPGSADRSRTPFGSMRLGHPLFGLSGSYRPITTTSSISGGAPGFLEPGTPAPSRAVTTRNQEMQFAGYLAMPKLPRLDASWTRRHRNGDALFKEETGITRVANLNYDAGPAYVRGGYNDLARDGGGFSARTILQRNVEGGTGVRLSPAAAVSLALSYDFSQSQRGDASGRNTRSRSQTASVSGGVRQSPKSDWSLSYAWRRAESPGTTRANLDGHEGSLSYNLQATRRVRFTTGTGLRTESLRDRRQLVRYANAVLSADGDIVHNVRASTSLAHVTNWLPSHSPYSVESWHSGARARLREGLELTDDLVITANGDTAALDTRVVTQNSLGLQATPLRSLTVALYDRRYHAGPSLLGTSADSRTLALDVRWRVVPSLELTTNASRTGLLPANDPRTSTVALGLRWNPSARFQFAGNYTRTGGSSRLADAALISGREFLTGRVLAGLSRTVTLSAGTSVADPGRASRSSQLDALLTKSFGR